MHLCVDSFTCLFTVLLLYVFICAYLLMSLLMYWLAVLLLDCPIHVCVYILFFLLVHILIRLLDLCHHGLWGPLARTSRPKGPPARRENPCLVAHR